MTTLHNMLVAFVALLPVLIGLAVIALVSCLATIMTIDKHSRYRFVAVTMQKIERVLVIVTCTALDWRVWRINKRIIPLLNHVTGVFDVRRYHLLAHAVGETCDACFDQEFLVIASNYDA